MRIIKFLRINIFLFLYIVSKSPIEPPKHLKLSEYSNNPYLNMVYKGKNPLLLEKIKKIKLTIILPKFAV